MAKFKKIKFVLSIAALAALSAGIAACAEKSDIDKYKEQGYDVIVNFDASGGQFLGRKGVSITRMYDSAEYMVNGTANIKITDPAENPDHIPTKNSPMSFYAGWYKTRELKKKDGKPIDYKGRELEYDEEDLTYYVKDAVDEQGNPVKEVSVPEYVYSDYWNFETDTVKVEEGHEGTTEITLYAGWVPYFTYNYYYQNDSGAWELYGTTEFDYKAVNTVEHMADYGTLYTPDWNDGAMSHTHERSDGSTFEFADINKSSLVDLKGAYYTFDAAYEDEACTKQITAPIEHGGSLDVITHTTTNAVKNIYVKYNKYKQYKIETADQLIKYADATARYEILADLDFTDKLWPSAFSSGTFTGEIEGHNYKIINASATLSGSNLQYGGLFGSIAAGAKIQNIAFENATIDFSALSRLGFNIGLFSGDINADAVISNVTVDGLVKVGGISVPETYEFNLLANGDVSGIKTSGITLQVYGADYILYNLYTINAEKVTVAANGDVTLVPAVTAEETQIEEKNYFEIITWRQNND